MKSGRYDLRDLNNESKIGKTGQNSEVTRYEKSFVDSSYTNIEDPNNFQSDSNNAHNTCYLTQTPNSSSLTLFAKPATV